MIIAYFHTVMLHTACSFVNHSICHISSILGIHSLGVLSSNNFKCIISRLADKYRLELFLASLLLLYLVLFVTGTVVIHVHAVQLHAW